MFRLLRNWIPFSTPVVAESTNSAVSTTMIRTARVSLIGTSQRKFSRC
jgi:hypothetical protein